MLSHLVDLDSLNCSEMDVFDACIPWVQAKCDYEGIDAISMANLRAALGDAIFIIRFCSMTADKFANINKIYTAILTTQETTKLFQTILLKATGETSSIFGANNSIANRNNFY